MIMNKKNLLAKKKLFKALPQENSCNHHIYESNTPESFLINRKDCVYTQYFVIFVITWLHAQRLTFETNIW